MLLPSRAVTTEFLPALSTGPCASNLAVAVPVSATRAVMPTRITAIAATSDTATIFRWVVRSAVTSEWFMGFFPPVLTSSRCDRAPGSNQKRPSAEIVSLACDFLASHRNAYRARLRPGKGGRGHECVQILDTQLCGRDQNGR